MELGVRAKLRKEERNAILHHKTLELLARLGCVISRSLEYALQ